MSSEKRELFRLAVLRTFDANNTRFGLTPAAVQHMTAVFGYVNPPIENVRMEIQYLEDKGHLVEVLKGISPENRAWRITAQGRDFLAGRSA